MAYATYEYYTTTFGGSEIPGERFIRCINLAGTYIDRFTYGRIKDPASVDGLADCACEMAEAVYAAKYKQDGSREKKSESIDGYSVSYVTEQKDGEDANALLARKLYSICSLYLMDTGLMYAGVHRC